MKSSILSGALAAGLALGMSACTNPDDPGRRPFGGAVAAGGGGAATGTLAGGAVEAVAGVPTTLSPPAYGSPPPGRYVAETACGPGWRWIRSHHDRDGRLVIGHCAPR